MADFYDTLKNIKIKPKQVEINLKKIQFIKSMKSINMLAFRQLVVLTAYNGITMFPDVNSVTINYFNNIGKSSLYFGLTEGSIAHIRNEYGIYPLCELDIVNIYMTHKINNPDYETVNVICDMLCQGGTIPTDISFEYDSKSANKSF